MTDGSFNPDNSIECRLAATEREMPPVYDKKGRNITPSIGMSNRGACEQQEWSWYQKQRRDKQREPIDFRRKEGD
jgi:DNA-directed RNA polymerase subunit M/transcription elongation factor TFIIS